MDAVVSCQVLPGQMKASVFHVAEREAECSHSTAAGAVSEKEYIKIWNWGGELLIVLGCSQTCLFEIEIKRLVLFTIPKINWTSCFNRF